MITSEAFLAFSFAAVLTACGGGGGGTSTVTPAVVNIAPVANAGKDQAAVTRMVVVLDGSASTDANNDSLTYKWSLESKPAGSVATLNAALTVKPTFTPDVAGTYYATLIVNDGKVNSTPSGVTVSITKAGLDSLPPANLPVERLSNWLIGSSKSPLTGVTTTSLVASGSGGDFVITCHGDGTYEYYFKTGSITANGAVKIRVGFNPIISETWFESPENGYQVLFPQTIRTDLLQMFYNNWNFVFQYNGFSTGISGTTKSVSGFSSAIDRTRDTCKWSTTTFPPQNGWGKPLPLLTPADAKEATDVSGNDITKTVRLIAWKALDISGKPQLIVRVGDPANNNYGMLIDDTRFYVTQNGKTFSAVSGLDFTSYSYQPTVLALNGDFDASQPLTLTLVGFNTSVLDTRTPMATVSLD